MRALTITCMSIVLAGVSATLGVGCATRPADRGGAQASAAWEPPATARLVPTRYAQDRYFATPVTSKGDTISIFLDTADRSVLWEVFAQQLGVTADDSVQTTRGLVKYTKLPAFRPDRSIPDVSVPTQPSNRTVLGPFADEFETRMSRNGVGQLGQQWFRDRIWTFDFPGHRLFLHTETPPQTSSPRTHRFSFEFRTDSAGRPVNQTPRVPVVIEGDTLLLLFDLGATVWLSDSALTKLGDHLPAERAWSLARQSYVARWHANHPDWRYLSRANTLNNADMIEVPIVSIGGFDVGPVWFGTLPDSPRPVPRRLRIDGTLGGSGLKYFVITIDYPNQSIAYTRLRGSQP